MGVRSSMLELAILGELQRPLHGYELRKRLSRTLGPLRRLSFGSIYPALHRLEERGLIRVTSPQSPGPRMPEKSSGQKSSSNRKQVSYQITAVGSEFLTASLATAQVDDDSLPLTIGLMSKATPATRLALLKERREQVLARQAAGKEDKQSKDFWVRSKAELDSEQAQSELDWLDRLIQADAAMAGGPPAEPAQ